MTREIKFGIRKLFGIFFIAGILILFLGFTEDVHADMEYYSYYQKVQVKKTGWYELKNKSKSSKETTGIAIVRKKKGNAAFSGIIKRGKKEQIYLKKGTYYLRQTLGEYSSKKYNKKFALTYKGKNYTPSLKENAVLKLQGDVLKSALYVKFKAAKTGEIEIWMESGFTNDNWIDAENYAKVTLCNQKKQAISDKTKIEHSEMTDGRYDKQNFAVIKGKTYYFKVSDLTEDVLFKYNFVENISNEYKMLNSYGKTKEKAVVLNNLSNETYYYCYIGLSGSESHWYVYNNIKDKAYISVYGKDHLGWYSSNHKDGFKVEIYDQNGRLIRESNTEGDEQGYINGDDIDGYEVSGMQKIYVKVTAKKKCMSSYSLYVRHGI